MANSNFWVKASGLNLACGYVWIYLRTYITKKTCV